MTDNNLINQQWTEFNKAFLTSFKRFTETNQAVMNMLLQNQFSMGNFAQLVQTNMATAADIKQVGTASMDSAMKQQLGALNLSSTTNAVKDLTEMNTTIFSGLLNQQVQLVNQCMASSTKFVENLKNAKTGNMEMLMAPQQLFTELLENMKATAGQTMMTIGGLEKQYEALAQNTLDSIIEESGKK